MAYGVHHVASQIDRWEIPGTYLVTELINEEDLLTIANQIARQNWPKEKLLPTNTWLSRHYKPCCRAESMKYLPYCSWTTSIGSWHMRSYFAARSAVPPSTHGKLLNVRWRSMLQL